MKKRISVKFLMAALFLGVVMGSSSCADSQDVVINGEVKTIEPYGWFDMDAKNPNLKYQVNTGNVVLSIIFSETVIVPILLTGDQLWEPIPLDK
jgi:hypothetical protein